MKSLQNLSAVDVQELLKNPNEHTFIDVRETHEYTQGHINGFINIPLSVLAKRLNEVDPQKSIVLTCRSGMRSMQAGKILKQKGFSKISHLKTGIMGWHKD